MAGKTDFNIREKSDSDREWINEWLSGGGATFIISRERKLFPADLPGFVAEDADGERLGLLTYEIVDDQCEIVTIDAFQQWRGIGSILLEKAIAVSRRENCRRLWLITTNDNVDAIRFYQRRGFTIAAIHVNQIARSRELKPTIPTIGMYRIPIRDEVEFEMML